MKVAGFEVSVTNILAVVAALWIGVTLAPDSERIATETVYRHVVPSDMRALVRDMQIETNGLRARLEGRHEVDPVVVVYTDTVVVPPDTVLVAARMTSAGDLELGRLVRSDSADHLFAPSIATRRPGNCDEGWSWNAGSFVCDPARLGHVYVYGEAGATWDGLAYGAHGSIGLWWQPSYRSAWRLDLGARTDGRLVLSLRRGLQLF